MTITLHNHLIYIKNIYLISYPTIHTNYLSPFLPSNLTLSNQQSQLIPNITLI